MIKPHENYEGIPCSIVACGCALGDSSYKTINRLVLEADRYGLTADGYLSLDGANKLIRGNFKVKKKVYLPRKDRVKLCDFLSENKGKYIICVLGHFIYAENGDYYSFFSNENDMVVCYWILE